MIDDFVTIARELALHPREHRERLVVAGLRVADDRREPADRLEVVREDVRPGAAHRPHRLGVAAEVGGEDLDEEPGDRP